MITHLARGQCRVYTAPPNPCRIGELKVISCMSAAPAGLPNNKPNHHATYAHIHLVPLLSSTTAVGSYYLLTFIIYTSMLRSYLPAVQLYTTAVHSCVHCTLTHTHSLTHTHTRKHARAHTHTHSYIAVACRSQPHCTLQPWKQRGHDRREPKAPRHTQMLLFPHCRCR